MSAQPVGSIPLLPSLPASCAADWSPPPSSAWKVRAPVIDRPVDRLGSQPGPSNDQRTVHLFVEGGAAAYWSTAHRDPRSTDRLMCCRRALFPFCANGPVLGTGSRGRDTSSSLIDVAWLVARLP